jgi:hypothetical protein
MPLTGRLVFSSTNPFEAEVETHELRWDSDDPILALLSGGMDHPGWGGAHPRAVDGARG